MLQVHRNPGNDEPLSKRVDDAMQFYESFHWGTPANRLVKRRIPKTPKVGVKLGKVHSITYETVKNGERALWEHEFGEEGGKRPDLVMDQASKRLFFVGGSYDVQPEGIRD